MGMLTNLQELVLNDNSLRELPAGMADLSNLERLSVRNNQLTTFPRWILDLTRLKTLEIGHNPCADSPEEQADILLRMKRANPMCEVLFE